jgi:transcriptional regulator with XRE-family HTH domain
LKEVIPITNSVEKYRKARGMTQVELAERVNVQQSAISLIERQERNPSLPLLVRLANVLGVTIDDLVGGGNAVSDDPTGG